MLMLFPITISMFQLKSSSWYCHIFVIFIINIWTGNNWLWVQMKGPLFDLCLLFLIFIYCFLGFKTKFKTNSIPFNSFNKRFSLFLIVDSAFFSCSSQLKISRFQDYYKCVRKFQKHVLVLLYLFSLYCSQIKKCFVVSLYKA